MDGVGLKAARNVMGMPVEMPPSIPPQRFVRVTTRPFSTAKASLFSLPRRRAAAKPAPNSTPLTAGMPNTICARRLSKPSNSASPSPAGTPRITHSATPPTLSPSAFAARIAASMAAGSLSPPISAARASIVTPARSRS